MAKYFDKFPLVDYNGVPAKNLLARVDFTQQTKKDIYANFDYILEEGRTRPDFVSSTYYDSPHYDWLLYLSNGVIDPYHDYYKTEDNLAATINAKYGSISRAENLILYYRNNWAPDDGGITVATYDDMAHNLKRYYRPIISASNQVLSYERKREDWITNTNKVVQLVLDDASEFYEGQRISQNSAEATVVSTDIANNSILIQHVDGTFVAGVLGDSNIVSVTLIQQAIPDDEMSFWAPVSAYEHEQEQNAYKKYVSIVKKSYLPDVERKFVEQIRR
jgi:Base plate wedge protein 53